jgi:hypothetical protein
MLLTVIFFNLALFQIQDSNFNENVLKSIVWAIRHDQPTLYEMGLDTLLILIKVN